MAPLDEGASTPEYPLHTAPVLVPRDPKQPISPFRLPVAATSATTTDPATVSDERPPSTPRNAKPRSVSMAMHSDYIRAKRKLKRVPEDCFTSPSLHAAAVASASASASAGIGAGISVEAGDVFGPSKHRWARPRRSAPAMTPRYALQQPAGALTLTVPSFGLPSSQEFAKIPASTHSDNESVSNNEGPQLVPDPLHFGTNTDAPIKAPHGGKSATRSLWPAFSWVSAGPSVNVFSQLVVIIMRMLGRLGVRFRARRLNASDSSIMVYGAVIATLALGLRNYASGALADDKAKLLAASTVAFRLAMNVQFALVYAVTFGLQCMLSPVARSVGWLTMTGLGQSLNSQFQIGRGSQGLERAGQVEASSATTTVTVWAQAITMATTSTVTSVATTTATKTVTSVSQPTTQLYVSTSTNDVDRAALAKCKSGLMQVVAEAMKEAEDGDSSDEEKEVVVGSKPFVHRQQTFECILP